MISCKTKIDMVHRINQEKASSHGSPLGVDEIKLVRNALNWKTKPFDIPNKILNEWRKIGKRGEILEKMEQNIK